jgi:hypothetical protein
MTTSLTALTNRTIALLGVSLLVPCMAAVWLLLKPQVVSGSTYLTFATLVLATGAIVLNTWRNAQATTNTSHVIYATEVALSAKR